MVHTQNRFQELDALRGLAALSVLLFHFTSNQNAEKLGWQFSYGVTGVDIFFMISGFVILLTIHKIKKWQDFAVFRFARLYPTYWACLLLTTIFILIYEPFSFTPVQLFANLTMFPVYFGIENLDGSYWTLLIELLFYFWILAVYMTNNLSRIINIAFFFTAGIVIFHWFGSYYSDAYQYAVLKIQLLNHFPLFFSGILFYNLKTKPFSVKIVTMILFSIAATCYLHDKGGRALQVISQTEHNWIIIFYHIVFGLFVYDRLTFLVHPYLIFLGKISYSLYLLHQFIGLHLIQTFNNNLHLNIYIAIILSIAICIVFAYLVTTFIEGPIIKEIRNWYKNRESNDLQSKAPVATRLQNELRKS